MSGDELKQVLVQSGIHLLTVHQPLQKLLSLIQQEHCEKQALIDTIECDPMLLLEFARIAAVHSLSEWHENLTVESARVVIITLCIEMLRCDSSDEEQVLLERFWLQSMAMAIAAEGIVQDLDETPGLGPDAAHTAYLTGLLSVTGQFRLLASEGESYQQYITQDEVNQGFEVAEQALVEEAQRFGKNRIELSADLLGSVDDEALLSEAIRYHCHSSDSLTDAHWLIRSLALARVIAPILLLADKTITEHCYLKSEQLLGLEKDRLDNIVARARARFEEKCQEFDISGIRRSPEQQEIGTDHLAPLRGSVSDVSVITAIQTYLECQPGSANWWGKVEKSTRLMFGFRNCFWFDLDSNNRRLIASRICPDITGFSVSIKTAQSILSRCVQEKRIVSSNELPDLSVVDRQLSRLAGNQGFICVPLEKASKIVAVLVCGVGEDSGLQLLANTNLMALFSRLIVREYGTYVSAQGMAEAQGASIDLDYYQRRAREVTHEVNNPLSVVQNYLKILSMKLDGNASIQADLTTISDEINRISGIVQKFTTFGTDADSGKRTASVNEIIGDLVSIFQASSPDIKFVLQLDETVPDINQSRDAIKQILVNLLRNSVEALDETGCIVIGTAGRIHVGGSRYVEISLSDDGPGIPEQVEARLFQEVDTGKGIDHQGLGLSIVKQLLDEMNGLITCRSRLGTGTDFQILIPHIDSEQ